MTKLFGLGLLLGMIGASPAWAGPVTVTTADGVKIAGVESGTGARGVVLIHSAEKSSEEWSIFAQKLSSTGFHVLNIDLRGHGKSSPPGLPAEGEWGKLSQDVAASVLWLKSKGATEVSLIGSQLGANLALVEASTDPGVKEIVLFSTALSANGVKVGQAIVDYGARPIFLVAGAEDQSGAKAATLLHDKATGLKTLHLVADSGKGPTLLNKDPALEGKIIAFLNQAINQKAVENAADQLKAGEVKEIKTEGVLFEDRKAPTP